MTYRSREFLDLAANQPCMFMLDGCCGAPCVSCHSNEQAHGKGVATKADDFMVAWGCANCHRRYDTGPEDDETKRAWFKLAHYRTLRVMFWEGWVGVLRRAVVHPDAAVAPPAWKKTWVKKKRPRQGSTDTPDKIIKRDPDRLA